MRIIENCKSVVLAFLIILSLFLTGSLWFDNYNDLYFGALTFSGFLDKKLDKEEISQSYEKIISPYKAVVINPDSNKWISYESDKMNSDAWNLVKNKLKTVSENTEIITGKIQEWNDLINRRTIILEFGGPVAYDIFRLAVPSLPQNINVFNNIQKISITKSLEGNTIYIMQVNGEEKNLYKILLKGEDEEIKTFMQSCENIKNDVKYISLEEAGITKFYNNKDVNISNDVLFPVSNKKDKRDLISKLNIKFYFSNKDNYYINKFVAEMFDNTDFAKFTTSDGGSIYINDDKSTIKIEGSSIVEYTNNKKISEDEMNYENDFDVAINFINDLDVFKDIFLYSAIKENESYIFKFSTAFDGVPLSYKGNIEGEDEKVIMNIKVENGVVKYFKGKLFETEVTEENKYISQIAHNILDAVLGDVETKGKVGISEVFITYDASKEGTAYPYWYIKYNAAPDYSKEYTTLVNVCEK